MYGPGYFLDMNARPPEVINIWEHHCSVKADPRRFGLKPSEISGDRDTDLKRVLRKGFVRIRMRQEDRREYWTLEFSLQPCDYLYSFLGRISEVLPRLGIKKDDALHLVQWRGYSPRSYDPEAGVIQRAYKSGDFVGMAKVFGIEIGVIPNIGETLASARKRTRKVLSGSRP